jgi:hypothetical protein
MTNNNNRTPVIFLAFANDHQDGTRYLRHLSEEARRLQNRLKQAEADGLCELVVEADVTIKEVLDIFQDQRYRHRIAMFHYGGHANGYQLLLESDDGAAAAADAVGFAAFLGQQRNLELVFLNGCSTQPQVEGLLEAGVSAVLATSQAIDDQIATEFSDRFYEQLAGGADIQTAFNTAAETAKQTKAGATRGLFWGEEETRAADRWPWDLYLREGTADTAYWSLPDAVDNPLFGLPELPDQPLPAQPFRRLERFTHRQTQIFFGRGYQIRALYNLVTSPAAAPIILFYGQSGVGKSSILDAGLTPRLAVSHRPYYLRRQEKSLVDTLGEALEVDKEVDNKATAIAAAWLAEEERLNQPLIIILDQVEELFSRPLPGQPNELNQLGAVLQTIFLNHPHQPQGKLILGFRKEWLGPIEKRLQEHRLQVDKLFVEPLDRRGIVEAVSGITRSVPLQQHYGLTIEDNLPEVIADDLLEDRGSAIAPALQVLLTKLWQNAQEKNNAQPHFSLELYQTRKDEGILLDDFLDQQLLMLEQRRPEPVKSGLALDLLMFFTTPMGTATEHPVGEIQQRYHHRLDVVDSLLQTLKDLYLLAEPAQQGQPATFRLAHDALAPLVRRRFDESDRSGQRARRILETQVRERRHQPEGHLLNLRSLELVEQSQPAMRAHTPEEEDLIRDSRKALERFIIPPLEADLFPSTLDVKKFIPEKKLIVGYRPTFTYWLKQQLLNLLKVVAISLPVSIFAAIRIEISFNLLGSQTSWVFLVLFVIISLGIWARFIRGSSFGIVFDLKKQITKAPKAPKKDTVKYLVVTIGSQKVGILSYAEIEFCHSQPVESEEAVAEQLVPFYLALNAALGHADVLNPFREVE